MDYLINPNTGDWEHELTLRVRFIRAAASSLDMLPCANRPLLAISFMFFSAYSCLAVKEI